jgi:hypothetical protein
MTKNSSARSKIVGNLGLLSCDPKAGIFPFRPNVFRDHNFATKTTDVDSSLGVQKEHSASFVMPSDITPVPDFQRPSTSGNTTFSKDSACLVTRITTQTKTARIY